MRFALVVGLVSACGPSSQDVAYARMTTYGGDLETVFKVVQETVANDYQITVEDKVHALTTPWTPVHRETKSTKPSGPGRVA